MAIVQIDPQAHEYSYLRGGLYGPGLGGSDNDGTPGHEASKCQIIKWQRPAEESPQFGMHKGKPAEDLMNIEINVFSEAYGMCRIFHTEPISANSGSKEKVWLAALGVAVSEEGAYDTDDVEGLECIVSIGDPYQTGDQSPNPGVWKTGNLRGIFGL